jgi:MFS family permease
MRLPAALVPLRHPAFRLLWWANIIANTGMWMQSTGAGWLMTNLAPTPVMVSMVQVASLLPMFLLALPAGALADLVDRRLYLIACQAWIAVSGALLALLAFSGELGAWGLIAFTFAIGAGTAMTSPAWSATTPEVVPRNDLAQAIVLNGIGFNMTRAIGPALGGFVIAFAGPELNFALNAVAFCVVIVALTLWRREAPRATLPREHFLSAMRAGVGFVRASPVLRGATLRGCVFFGFAAAIWSVLPLLVRQQLGLGPEWFGILLGAMGVGAVSAGLLLPSLRPYLSRSQTVTAACVLSGVALILLGLSTHWSLALVAMLMFGAAWLGAASNLQAAAQLASPAWVRARAIGIYQLATFGALALGTALGGIAGDRLGIPLALGLFGLAGAITAIAVRRLPIEAAAAPAVAPAEAPRPEPHDPSLAPLLGDERHQLLEVVRYSIAPKDRDAFLAAMQECRRVRLRCGALDWRLFEDVAHAERWLEIWLMENWTAHLREEGRLTDTDRAALARAAAFQQDGAAPEAVRYLNVPHEMFR